MKTIDEHRAQLRKITDLAFAFGIDSLTEDQKRRLPLRLTAEERIFFKRKCHEGFKQAQSLLISEMLSYQDHLRIEKGDLKEARRKRNKILEESIGEKIGVIEQRLRTFSHVADGIAWQMIGGEIHIARRFYIGERDLKQLTASNIKHAINVADEMNSNPDDFALLSDLTAFVQIGDLLVVHKETFGVMELKEGKVNHEISQFLNELEKQKKSLDDQQLDSIDPDTLKQIKRILRQKERMSRMAEVLKNDKGINPGTGDKIKVFTPSVFIERYHIELSKLHGQLKTEPYSYTVIDGCVHIGMYNEEAILQGGFLLIELILKEKATNYIVIDWLSITHNLSEPIFGKPLAPDFIIDVLTGKAKVIIGLNLDVLHRSF